MKLRGKVSFRASMRQTGKVTAARDGWRGCAAGREFYGPQKIQFPAFIWEFRIGPLTRKEVSHNRLANGLSALCHGQRGPLAVCVHDFVDLARSLVLDRARASIQVVPHDLDRPSSPVVLMLFGDVDVPRLDLAFRSRLAIVPQSLTFSLINFAQRVDAG